MGYNTWIDGQIDVPGNTKQEIEAVFSLGPRSPRSSATTDGKVVQMQEDLLQDMRGNITAEDDQLIFSDSIKNYDKQLEMLCAYIAHVFPDAEGEVFCSGDDGDDLWKIEVKDGVAQTLQGTLIYGYAQDIQYDFTGYTKAQT